VSVSQSVQNLLNTIAHSVPKIGVFILVLIVGWIVASIVRRVIEALLKRVHFDQMAERGPIGQALSSRGYHASNLLARIIYYAVLLITLQLAFGVFGPNPVSTMLNGMVNWLPKAFVAVILVVVASAIAKVVKDLIGAALGGLSYGRFIASAAAIVIIALGVIAALNQVDVASAITQPVLIATLATVGAILAIGIGGGMVRPMEQRWERMLDAAERETSSMAAYQRGRQDALSSPGAVAGMAGAGETGAEASQHAYAGHPGQQAGYAGQQGTGYAGSPQGQAGPPPAQSGQQYEGQQYEGQQGPGYAGPPEGQAGPPEAQGGPQYTPPEGFGYAGPEGPQGPGQPAPPHGHMPAPGMGEQPPPGPGGEMPPQQHHGRPDTP
jgi:hypothetical protein